MIEMTVQRSSGSGPGIKILGIGGAGANALDRLALDGVNPAYLIAANTDAQALTACVAGVKIQLGKTVTRGLGSGGDPELGRSAAVEAAGQIRSALEGVDCLFLLAGLGGGTGSGAARVVAEMARDASALVIAVLTLPFSFEGKRRISQATEALAAIQESADAVVCFENDRMANFVSPKAGIQQTFAVADQTISQCVQAIVAILSRDGVIHLGFDDFRAALHTAQASGGRCLFGYGEASGDNRPYDALARAFKNPLMDKGRMLRDCNSVLVQVSGGLELTLNEVQLLMEEFNRHVGEKTRILFGAAVDPQLAGRIAVTVLSSVGSESSSGASKLVQTSKQPDSIMPVSFAPVELPTGPLEELAQCPTGPEEHEEPMPEVEVAFVVSPQESPEEEAEVAECDTEAAQKPFAAPVPVLSAGKLAPTRSLELAAQRSLFDEPTETEAVQPVSAPPPPPRARITRPVPGRTLQPSPSRGPRKVDPPEPPVQQEPPAPVAPPSPEPPQADIPSFPVPVAPPEPVFTPMPAILRRPLPPPTEPSAAPAAPAVPKAPQQETLQFEPVTRGRFEKSEPTIVDGQDLDVPTFLRRNIRIR